VRDSTPEAAFTAKFNAHCPSVASGLEPEAGVP
jgi:hypothetical protein